LRIRGGTVESGVCDKEVKSQDQGVTCDLCDVSQALYLCLIQECKDGKGSGIHWYCADCNIIAKKSLTKLEGLQEKQDKLEGELMEVRKEIKTMNTAVEGVQKIGEEIRKNSNRAYAEVLEGVQQELKGIKG